MQQRVCQMKVSDISEAKQQLIDVCRGFKRSTTDGLISEWHKRLHACIHEKGEHFEHLI